MSQDTGRPTAPDPGAGSGPRTHTGGPDPAATAATPDSEPQWARSALSDDPTDWPLGRLLYTAAQRVKREWNAHLAATDLNHASVPVLFLLLHAPHTQSELAAACKVTEQTMSRVLARLERTGYLERTTHPEDRRKHRVQITGSGRRAVLLGADLSAAEQIAARGLTTEQADTLRALLSIVVHPDATHGDVPGPRAGATSSPRDPDHPPVDADG